MGLRKYIASIKEIGRNSQAVSFQIACPRCGATSAIETRGESDAKSLIRKCNFCKQKYWEDQ